MNRHLPFVWVFFAFVAGIFLHEHENQILNEILFLIPTALLSCFLFRRRKLIFGVLILIVFVLLGWLSAHSRWIFADDHIYFKKYGMDFSSIAVRGVIVSDVRESKDRTNFVLSLKEPGSGKVMVNVFQGLPLRFGDEIIVVGNLHKPFDFRSDGRFSYRQYLKRQGIYFVLSVKKKTVVNILRRNQANPVLTALYFLRRQASQVFAKYLYKNEASLMQAMLLGERTQIPQFLKDLFAKTGTAHILAISGLNVGIVVAVLFLILRLIPSPMSFTYIFTMIFIGLYVILTGASPSVVRAGIMSAVFLTGFVIERETDSINSLGFAGFLLLLIDPQNFFDIGFQLSFLSVLSILLFYPLFMNFFKKFNKNKVIQFFFETFSVSLAATLGVAGLIAYYFHIVTPISLLANILVVPLSSLALVLGMGMLVFGVFSPFFVICIEFVLSLMIWIMVICQHVPFSCYVFKAVNHWSVVSYYLFVLLLFLCLRDLPQIDKKS